MEFLVVINGGYDDLIQDYYDRHKPPSEVRFDPAVAVVVDNQIVGMCFYEEKPSGGYLQSIYLHIHLAEEYRNRMLSRNTSLLLNGFKYFDSLSDSTYKDYRGVKAMVANERGTESVMNYLGFKKAAPETNSNIYEKVFTK